MQMELEGRVRSLESRVGLIEQRLRIWQPAPPEDLIFEPTTSAEPVPTGELAAKPPVEPEPPHKPAAPLGDVLTAMTHERREKQRAESERLHTPPPLPPPVAYEIPQAALALVAQVHYQPAPAAQPPAHSGLEQTLGLKWAGWVGAIVLIIGAALGVRYVYDQGWFAAVPAGVWLSLIAISGIALLVAGDYVYRKINHVPGASLMGAGLATLFLASFAGNSYYQLYDVHVAMGLTVIVTLVGAAVARRGNLVSIAVISIIGGNLIPLLVRTPHPPLAPFLLYLLMLQLVALSLAYLGASGKWWALRTLSLATTSLWMAGVLVGGTWPDETGLQLAFALLFAFAFQLELIASALKRASIGKVGANISLLVTTFLALAILFILRGQSEHVRTTAVLSLAAVCGGIAALLPWKRQPRNDGIVALAFGFGLQSAALIVLAVPIAMTGLGIAVGWGVLAIGFAVLGARGGLRSSKIAAIVTWILAALDLLKDLAFPSGRAFTAAPLLTVQATNIRPWLIVACATALMGQMIAWLGAKNSHNERRKTQDVWFMSIASIALWMIASVDTLPPLAATISIVALAWILALADITSRKIAWAVQGGAILLAAAVKWTVIDALADRFSGQWTGLAHQPMFNGMMATAIILALSLPAIYYLRRSSYRVLMQTGGIDREAGFIFGLWTAVVSLLTLSLSLQIDLAVARAQNLLWPKDQLELLLLTILWTFSSMALWAAGLWTDRREAVTRRSHHLRWLPILLVCKFLTMDTLYWRMDFAPADVTVLMNVLSLTGAMLAAAIGIQWWFARRAGETAMNHGSAFMAVLIVLCVGSLEIDRAFTHPLQSAFANPLRAREVAISIFWSIFAVACVAGGFKVRAAALRYFGLGLFGVTLLKVVFIDLGEVGAGYRILSFMGLGVLLLGTSVLYGKLSPRLLGDHTKT